MEKIGSPKLLRMNVSGQPLSNELMEENVSMKKEVYVNMLLGILE